MENPVNTTDSQELLTKEQAANFLGTSPKTIQRYTSLGHLAVTYIKEGKLQRAYYKLEDLKAFQQQDRSTYGSYGANKATPTTEQSSVDTQDILTIDKPSMDNKSLVQGQHNPEKAIAKLIAQVLTEAQRRGLVALAATGDSSPVGKQSNKLSVPIADKMVLSIAEASALSGRPQAELRKAFQQGKLKGVKLGKGIKVRKKDLEAYIDSLFGES